MLYLKSAFSNSSIFLSIYNWNIRSYFHSHIVNGSKVKAQKFMLYININHL
jgi:hypothetical protein